METSKVLKSSIVLGISLIVSFTIFGFLFYQSRIEKRTVSVIGSATKRHISDVIKWQVTMTRNVDVNDLKAGYNLIEKDMNNVLQLLKSNGIDEKSVTIRPIETSSKYDKKEQQIGYNLQQTF